MFITSINSTRLDKSKSNYWWSIAHCTREIFNERKKEKKSKLFFFLLFRWRKWLGKVSYRVLRLQICKVGGVLFGRKVTSTGLARQTDRLISVGLAVRETVVDVLTVRSGVREALQTFGTLERLLARMKSTMFRQVMFVLESLVAVGALVRTRIWKKNPRN